MKTAICAILKNEQRFLKEWIDWHLSLGFDVIHLFEDKGSDSHEDIVREYDSKVCLTRYETDSQLRELLAEQWSSSRQDKLYDWFAKKYSYTYDWVAFIDLDEFVFFAEGYNLENLCKEFEPYPAVLLNWRMMGANGHILRPESVIKGYTKEAVYEGYFECSWWHKSFVNLKRYKGLANLHRATDAVNTLHSTDYNQTCYSKAWLNHYFTKSWEDWCDRIFSRGGTLVGHRKLSDFFHCNADMQPLRKELIDSVAHKIPVGSHWLDKEHGLIAGGNIREIYKLNGAQRSELYEYKGHFYAVSDMYAVSSISKCACSTVALQTLLYYNQITEQDCIELRHVRIGPKHRDALQIQKMHNALKVWIFRDPIERLVSAYFSISNGTEWQSFLKNKAPELVTWERHFIPQVQYHEGEAPDVYVELKDYDAFCREHGIPVFSANVNTSEDYQKFQLSEIDKWRIKQLYADDYAFIEQIKQSCKCYKT